MSDLEVDALTNVVAKLKIEVCLLIVFSSLVSLCLACVSS